MVRVFMTMVLFGIFFFPFFDYLYIIHYFFFFLKQYIIHMVEGTGLMIYFPLPFAIVWQL